MASQSFQLVMRSGPTPGKVFELSKNENYIGRDISNDIVVNDSEVSRKHARLVLQAGSFVLEDLGSTNGTFVNGQRLMGPHVLKPGELIMLGENVGLAFEAGYDENATMVASAGPAATYTPPPATPREAYVPPVRQEAGPMPPSTPASQPMYSGQVPPGPAEIFSEPVPEEKKNNRTWLYIGCGCLVVLLCVVVAGAFAFDYLNLYCTPPFNALFTCP
jgi:predicted component of type VI protein secretion system